MNQILKFFRNKQNVVSKCKSSTCLLLRSVFLLQKEVLPFRKILRDLPQEFPVFYDRQILKPVFLSESIVKVIQRYTVVFIITIQDGSFQIALRLRKILGNHRVSGAFVINPCEMAKNRARLVQNLDKNSLSLASKKATRGKTVLLYAS